MLVCVVEQMNILPFPEEIWNQYWSNQPYSEDALIHYYEPLIQVIFASLNLPSYAEIDIDSIKNCGRIGLSKAIRKFNLNANTRFTTFAHFYIHGAMVDEVRRMGIASRAQLELKSRVEAIEADFHLIGHVPTDAQVRSLLTPAQQLQFDKGIHKYLPSMFPIFSENDKTDDNDHHVDPPELVDFSVEETLARRDDLYFIKQNLHRLTDKERIIFTLYFLQEMRLVEIATELKVSEARVHQVVNTVIVKLRKMVPTD